MAALYTEIVLDRLFSAQRQLLADLNAFVHERNARRLPGEAQDEPFTEDDLTKLAFWMATGSGKILLLHLNYYQFLHYNREPLDNILLITPNEGLSEQHLAELAASGIPARRFDVNAGGLWSERDVVQVIEITKLVEEKRGGGVSGTGRAPSRLLGARPPGNLCHPRTELGPPPPWMAGHASSY